ncbi:phage tail fiber protein [Burkholderia gladioli]|uniref:phage tail fiber protein n=1 Tax=Burkholderia gladioli TaxID=28095 RepID=UPI002B241E06|nr:phage tail protein [Burkholderia gladioli]MEB2546582.1 phage tail protein [Burkholderia gladioli]
MAGNLIQITDAGRAALVAPGNTGTAAHRVVSIGLATAAFAFDRAMLALPNERKRITTFGGENVAADTIHVVLQDDTADQYALYGFGLYLDSGVLFGVYVQDAPIMEKSPAAILLLAADAVFATIDAAQLEFGPTTFLNPPATTERQGVVELATVDEVAAGADATRAVTPLGAAKRYMPTSGGIFSGPIAVQAAVDTNNAQVVVSPAVGKLGAESKVRFSAAFGDPKYNDTSPRVVASVRAGFNGGVWGSEYLDFHLNRVPNDARDDANMDRVLRLAAGGRAVIGATQDDGGTALQVGGSVRANNYGIGDQGSKASGLVGISNGTNGPNVGFYGRESIGGGVLTLSAGGKERVRLQGDGKLLIGTDTPDASAAVLQVAGAASVTGSIIANGTGAFARGVQSTGLDDGGGSFRATNGGYGAFLRNDGSHMYLLSTKKGDPLGSFNDYRPFAWDLDSGYVTIDNNGHGASVGGALSITTSASIGRGRDQGVIWLGPRNDGYLYSTADSCGWWYGAAGSVQYVFGDHSLRVDNQPVWHAGNLTPLDRNAGGWMASDVHFSPGARLVLSEGSPGAPSLTFENDGAPDTGLYHVADGQFGVTCNSQPIVGFAPDGTRFTSNVFGPTPAAGDRSTRFATTEWVLSALSSSSIGQIVFEPRTTTRAGFLKANGSLLERADYPALWAYAQASGALITDAAWWAGQSGCFSTGTTSTNFRIPELRGEFLRCLDDGRGLDTGRVAGSLQLGQNAKHSHDASSATAGSHAHSAWSDASGSHNHAIAQDPHGHGIGTGAVQVSGTGIGAGYGPYNGRVNQLVTDLSNANIAILPTGDHAHGIGTYPAGDHAHSITVQASGGDEARPRNIALLALIRAY